MNIGSLASPDIFNVGSLIYIPDSPETGIYAVTFVSRLDLCLPLTCFSFEDSIWPSELMANDSLHLPKINFLSAETHNQMAVVIISTPVRSIKYCRHQMLANSGLMQDKQLFQ